LEEPLAVVKFKNEQPIELDNIEIQHKAAQ